MFRSASSETSSSVNSHSDHSDDSNSHCEDKRSERNSDDDSLTETTSRRSYTSSRSASLNSRYSDQSDRSDISFNPDRVYSMPYKRRSYERTYYSPNYCPWSRNTSERDTDTDSSVSNGICRFFTRNQQTKFMLPIFIYV